MTCGGMEGSAGVSQACGRWLPEMRPQRAGVFRAELRTGAGQHAGAGAGSRHVAWAGQVTWRDGANGCGVVHIRRERPLQGGWPSCR